MKKLLVLVSALMMVLTLAACKPGGDDFELVVTLNGLEDQTITAGDAIDLLEGITATGNDDMDYTDVINVDSDDCVVTDGTIDTSVPGTCHITYTAVVDGKMVRETLIVTINPVEVGPVDGPVLMEWDFEEEADLDGWGKYEADGGSVTESIDNGTLKLEVVSATTPYGARLDYMGLPMEDGENYEVTFQAKSSVAGKGIHLQYGELISSDPWFWDFKPGQGEFANLTTDWAEYSYSFTYNKDQDSGFGGPVFEMGNIAAGMEAGFVSEGIDATIWIDDLVIKGGSGTDTVAPVITGADDVTYFLEDSPVWNATDGVTAEDFVDGDLTASIVVGGDTVDVATAGVYFVTYTVTDAAGNEAVVTRAVTIKSDTDAPVLSGVEDVTYFLGDGKDALSDVMAMDARDGDVTANIVLSGDTYDPLTEGTYTVTYTVSDAAGNEATATRVITLMDVSFIASGELANGSFDDGAWNLFVAQWTGAAATFEVVDGELVVDIEAFGLDGGNPFTWGVIVEQADINLVVGKTYRVSFDAMASVDRDVTVELDGDALAGNVSLTTTMTTHTLDLVYTGTEDKVGTFKLLLGEINSAAVGTVTLDNIMVEEFDGAAVVADTDQIENGDFTEDTMLSGWNMWQNDNAGDFRIYYNEAWYTYGVAGEESWHNKLEYLGVNMTAGLTYRLTFKAKGDAVRDFQVSFWDGGQGFESGALELGTDYQTYTYIFEYTGGATANLEFQLGKVSDNFAGTVFYVDEVVLEVEDGTPPAPVTLDMMPNQDFTDADISGWGTEGTLTLAHNATDGTMEVTVTELGANPWDQNIGFPMLNVLNGKEYTVSYVVKTAFPEGRDVTFFAENTDAGYAKYFEQTETLTSDYQTFTYTFAPDADNNDTKLGIFFGNTSNPLVGTVIIDSITITVADAPVLGLRWEGFGGTTVVDNTTDVDIAYNVTTQWWWDFSAQHLGVDFDGTTFNAIDFTFTGENGHNYKFKVEYDGGAKETGDILADGTEQVTQLDLSSLTPEQLSSINKVVVFLVADGSVTPVTSNVNVAYALVTITPPAPETLATLPNQDFSDADISAWGTQGDVTIAHNATDGTLEATVNSLGGNPWDVNISAGGFDVIAGNTYEVTFVIRTAFVEGRDVTFFVENVDAGYAKYLEETRTLTDSFQTFTFTFTPTENNDDTNLGLFLGNTSNPLTGVVIIDSVTITETAPAS